MNDEILNRKIKSISAMEGLALHKEGISPYSGDIFHEVITSIFYL
jgi:hypothetical protein